MKRKVHGGAIAALILVLLAAVVLAVPSVQQNQRVRADFTALFTAIQEQDAEKLQAIYEPSTGLDAVYLEQVMRYKLLGWKIERIVGQPWPMEGRGDYRVLEAELYFDGVPDTLVKPQGDYERRTTSPVGPCVVVPVRLQFAYYNPTGTPGKDSVLNLVPPRYLDGKNWTAPFAGPLKETPPAR
jgi:hypothetical protein